MQSPEERKGCVPALGKILRVLGNLFGRNQILINKTVLVFGFKNKCFKVLKGIVFGVINLSLFSEILFSCYK